MMGVGRDEGVMCTITISICTIRLATLAHTPRLQDEDLPTTCVVVKRDHAIHIPSAAVSCEL